MHFDQRNHSWSICSPPKRQIQRSQWAHRARQNATAGSLQKGHSRSQQGFDKGHHRISRRQSELAAVDARLLWRGSLLINESGVRLHGTALRPRKDAVEYESGLAFVAQEEASTSTRPSLLRTLSHSSSHAALQDDPFASTSRGDICLGLEMMRHAELCVQRTVELKSDLPARKRKSKVNSLKAGIMDQVEVEASDVDVRVYVDPRCGRTRQWLEQQFCEENVRRRFAACLAQPSCAAPVARSHQQRTFIHSRRRTRSVSLWSPVNARQSNYILQTARVLALSFYTALSTHIHPTSSSSA
jgi:hypothetical protein